MEKIKHVAFIKKPLRWLNLGSFFLVTVDIAGCNFKGELGKSTVELEQQHYDTVLRVHTMDKTLQKSS